MTAAFATTPFERTTGNASSFAKTRASAVGAGSVLWAFTWQYNATNTCTGVSDDLGGTWVQAFGPTRAGTNNGASNASIYGWYKLNSAAGGTPTNGTVTATWSGAAAGGIVIGEVTGLAGGGALDAQVSALVDSTPADISFGVTPTLAQAIEAAVMFVVAPGSAGLTSPHSPFVVDSSIDSFNFERVYRAITSSTAAVDVGLTASAAVTDVGGAMFFKDLVAPPVITGPSGAAGAGSSSKSVAEGVTAVHTFTADVAVSWSKNGGADEADFTINPSTGALAFAAAPDFEAPGDSDTNNTYVVVVRATATVGGATADQTVTVTVTNASEPPLAPTIGTATAGNTTASVAFTPPSNTGRPAISGYTATSSPGGITGTGASSPITVSGLTNGTAYTFTVTATNADGTGPASAASNSVTPSPGGDATLPTLTGSITIGAVTSDSIQMSWPAGSDNTAVTSYEVSSNGGSSYTDVGAVLTHTFTGLTASTSYDLRVRAKDAAGNVSTPALAATQSTGAAAVAGFDLDTAAGCVFGAIAGSLTSISREVGVAYKVAVYNTSTRALIFESASLTTNSAGRLSRFTTGLCTIGVTYDLVAKRVSDGAIACFRLAAT